MATINWPIPTVVGQIYTSTNGDAWRWTGDYWQSIGTSSIGGTGAANQVTLWSGTNALTGTNAIAYTNTPGSNINITISDSGFGSVLGRGIVDTSVSNGAATNTIRSGSNINVINPSLEFKRAKNSLAVPNTITIGTVIGEVKYSGAYDSLGNYRTSAYIRSEASELWGATASGTKLSISTMSNGQWNGLTERFSIEGNGLIRFYGIYTFPVSNGTINQVLSTNGAGTLSWSSITAASLGAVSGTGTANYLARWTPGSTTLGTSTIRDDGTSIGIGTTPGSQRVAIQSATAYTMTVQNTQVNGMATQFYSNAGGNNVGIQVQAGTGTSGFVIGIQSLVVGGSAGQKYSVQLQDGTQAAGRFLKSMDSQGNGNWASLTTADVAGSLSGTGVNNRIALWTGTSTVSSDAKLTYSVSADPIINGVGTTNKFTIGGTTSGITSVNFADFGLVSINAVSNQYPRLILGHQRGTFASQTPALNGDILGEINWAGGVTYGAYIRSNATINHVAPSTAGSDLQFGTINNSNINAIRLRITNTGAIKFNEVYTFPTTDGTSNQVLKTDGVGNLSWTNSGTVNGTGTPNYLARWTGSGTTLTNGITQDNGVGVSIGPTAIINTQKLRVVGDSTNVNVTEFIHLNASGGDNRSFLFNMEGSVGSSYNYGIVSRASSAISSNSGYLSYGVLGIAGSTSQSGTTTGGFSIGVKGVGFMKAQSTNNTNGAIGVQGMAFGGTVGATSYGVYAYGHTDNYNLGFALNDSNKGIGKFIKCVDGIGGATWANITTADVTGSLTGAGATNKMAFWTNGTNLSYDNGIQVTSGTNPMIQIQPNSGGIQGLLTLTPTSVQMSSNATNPVLIIDSSSNSFFPIIQLTRSRLTGGTLDQDILSEVRIVNSGQQGVILRSRAEGAYVLSPQNAGSSFDILTLSINTSFAAQTSRFKITGGFFNNISSLYQSPQVQVKNSTFEVGTVLSPSQLSGSGDRKYQMQLVATDAVNGIYSQSYLPSSGPGGDSINTAIKGESINATGTRIGVYGVAGTSTILNIGIKGEVSGSGTGSVSVGGHFVVPTGATAYSLWLQDGTQGIGKVLTSLTVDGKARWAEITPEITKNKIIRLFGTSGLGTGLTASTAVNKSAIGSGTSLDPLTKTATMPISLAVGWVGTSVYDAATGIFTAPTTGWYEISYNVSLQPSFVSGWASTSQITAMVIDSAAPTNYYMTSRGVAGSYTPTHLCTNNYQKVYLTAGKTLKLRILLNGLQNYVTLAGDILEWNITFLGN